MKHSLPARIAGAMAGLANGLFGGGGGMVFVPILSRWGGLDRQKLFASCVGVIFPVCLVSAAVYWLRGGVSLREALPYLLGGADVSAMDDDHQAEIRNKMLGFIFQQYNLIPKLTVLENVELPLLYAALPAEERRRRALEALDRVGLADKYRNLPNQLSGGQQQRVSIARALAGKPSVILADEPTGALDSRTGREVLDFLRQLNAEGDTVVLITHDNSIARKAKRIIRLQDGRVIYDGDAADPRAVVHSEDGEEAGV